MGASALSAETRPAPAPTDSNAQRHRACLAFLRGLEAWGHRRAWTGSDPYDALNATRLVRPLRASPLGRRVLTQLVKRSTLDLRPLLGIRPEPNAAAIAHVVSAYARGGFLAREAEERRLRLALDALDALRTRSYREPCWGYPFDVQTRVFFYARSCPNSIATAFAGQALLDAWERTHDGALLERAVGAGEFFLEHVPLTRAGAGAFFGYLPGDRTPIHNANLLVCALLARLAAHTGRNEFAAAAEQGTRYTVALQRPDGSWPYGEEPGLAWVDGYHTGYVLQALMSCRDHGVAAADAEVIARGLHHYRRALFGDDGAPRFTTTSQYPIDSECVAQGLQTFALAARDDAAALEPAWSIFEFARRRMRRADGAIIFQRGRLWANRTPHVRWAAASMFLAATHLLRAGTARG